MKIIFDKFLSKTNNLDKLLISLIFFFPFLLIISIFLADLFASISALIVIGLFFFKNEKKILFQIKPESYYFLIFYFLLLISLIFSISFKISFLPSFFYFRYFLFAVAIFYLFKKYTFFKDIFFKISTLVVIFSFGFALIIVKNYLLTVNPGMNFFQDETEPHIYFL